jgi:hypothetical protein
MCLISAIIFLYHSILECDGRRLFLYYNYDDYFYISIQLSTELVFISNYNYLNYLF